MATLHIFNPEHDIALASNLSNFTSPHAGRQLRHDLGYLPAIWADDADYVLVDDVAFAQTAFSRLMHRPFPHFIDKSQLSIVRSALPLGSSKNSQFSIVNSWGWDLALRAFLLRHGVTSVPSESAIADIRELSHRRYAVGLLKELTELMGSPLTGRSWEVGSLEEVRALLSDHGRIVVKAPWSSSGRGIRFIDGSLDDYQVRWMQNVIQRQGSVIVEVYCPKVKDFGMEFESDGEGNVRYLGLSLFHTQNGAYTGNIIASEEEKREVLSRYIPISLLDTVQAEICRCLGSLYLGRYAGPFGVDMMLVNNCQLSIINSQFLLNPCIEINLRRTMGHVALSLARQLPSGRAMHIEFSDATYKLRIKTL